MGRGARHLFLVTFSILIVACPGQGSDPDSSLPPRDAAPDSARDGAADSALDGDVDGDADFEEEIWTAQAANNRDYLPIALEMIENAETRVHVIEYVIYPGGQVQQILDALMEAAGRGVEVMVLADEEAEQTQEALQMLRDAGVETQFDSPSRLTHNKLIIADDEVLVGSTNLSNNALARNNEANLHVNGADVAAYYEEYFQALWSDSSTEPGILWGRDTRLVPLSNRDIFSALHRCIQRADTEIMVLLYAMKYDESYPGSSYNQLVEALVAAHQEGRDVRVVLDGSDWIRENEINDRAQELLTSAGIVVRNPPASRITHAKLLICDDTVVVSDANWAYSALEQYHGTSVQVTDADIARQYEDYFRMVWDQSFEP